ncbi:MAG TPA: DUF3800 domain-containing protein [Candidatus Paceibacterota bacterium]
MYIFLDESGNFKGDSNDHFIAGGFVTGNQRRTSKAFRKSQHIKFPKKIRAKTEVKFVDSGLHDELRLKTLSYLAKQDIRVFYSFLKTKKYPSSISQKERA